MLRRTRRNSGHHPSSARHADSGERGQLACSAGQLAEQKFRRQTADSPSRTGIEAGSLCSPEVRVLLSSMRWVWLAVMLTLTGCSRSQTQIVDLASERQRMVQEQLAARDIHDERVLAAMR